MTAASTARLPIKSRPFEFTNDDGIKLTGRLELPIVPQPPRAMGVFAHCFTCSKNIKAASVISQTLAAQGIGILRFDFTGLGNSEGDFSNTNFSSNVEDLIAAARALQAQGFGAVQLLVGHSLGGAAVLKAAGQIPSVRAVATLAAPSEVEHVTHLFEESLEEIRAQGEAQVKLAGRPFTLKKQFVEDLTRHSILDDWKSNNTGPDRRALLVAHSPVDETVSIEHASNIYLAVKHPKSFLSLDQADHLLSNPADASYAAEVIASWATRYLELNSGESATSGDEVLVESLTGHKFAQQITAGNHRYLGDEPRGVGGDDAGPAPYDYLLSALGACTAMTLRMYADYKKLPLEKVTVRLTHDRVHFQDCDTCADDEKPEDANAKIERITKHITVSGDLTEEQVQRLLEIAEKCPVNKTLKGSPHVAGSIEHVK